MKEEHKCKRVQKHKGIIALMACAIILYVPVVFADVGTVKEAEKAGAGGVIGSIKTKGNINVKYVDILAKVRSRVGETFDPNTAAEDVKRIAGLSGVEYSYYNTAVVDGKIQLTFVVVEKNLARAITFAGNHEYKSDTLKKKLDFKIGDYLDAVMAESGRKALVDFYNKEGYSFAEVTLDNGQIPLGKAAYTIVEGPRVKISSVKFSGNKALKTGELKDVVKTKTREYLIFQKYYNKDEVAEDVTKIQNAYYQKGYLNADVTAKEKFNADKSKASITFLINEGSVYTVEKVAISGNKRFDENTIRSKLRLEKGQVYSEQKADSDVKHILKLYREEGYIDAKVERKREFASGNTVNIGFEITEGEQFRIGQITIAGNEQTQDRVIRRVLDEYDFLPGRLYNTDMARGDGSGELEKTVKTTTVMESVTITPTGQKPGQRDAQVNVTEGQTGMIMLGAGVASDSGVIGQLVFEQRNFDIKNRPKDFEDFITGQAYKGAGQTFRIALQPGTQVSEYSVSFSDPYFQDKPITFDMSGSSYERARESYDEKRLKGYTGFERRYRDHWHTGIGFRMEDVTVASVENDAPKEIKDVKGGNGLAGVRFGIGRDLTDSRFTPSTGKSYDASYEQVGGDFMFGILSGTYRQYHTLYEDLAERKTVLLTRLYAATTVGDAPPFEKFYAGGSTSIRGFEYRGVSTRGYPTTVGGVPITSAKKKDPIGSDWIFLANAEVTVPMVGESLSSLFFIDSGTIDSGNYRVSIGTGVQIMLPHWFGPVPIRFEFAVPVMKDGSDKTQVFSFSAGRLF